MLYDVLKITVNVIEIYNRIKEIDKFQCLMFYFHRFSTAGFWNDQNCGAPQPFVCKKPKDSVGPVTHAPTTPKEGGCMDSSWLKVHSKCYKVFDGAADNAKTFDDARKTCQQFRNGDIATILNPETQGWLSFLYKITLYWFPKICLLKKYRACLSVPAFYFCNLKIKCPAFSDELHPA